MQRPTRIVGCLTFLLIIGGAFATISSAQTPAVPFVEANKPFKVQFDHDGQNVTHYRVFLDAKQVVEVPASARVNGSVLIDMAALPVGRYTLVAVARNAPATPFTEPSESSTAPLIFESRVKALEPNPPTWRETTIILADGTRRLESIVHLASGVDVLRVAGPQ